MKDKTKGQFINELTAMRRRIAELEAAETARVQPEEALRQHRDHLEELVAERRPS